MADSTNPSLTTYIHHSQHENNAHSHSHQHTVHFYQNRPPSLEVSRRELIECTEVAVIEDNGSARKRNNQQQQQSQNNHYRQEHQHSSTGLMEEEQEALSLILTGKDAEFIECEKLLMKAVKLKWEQSYQLAYQITRYCVNKWPQYYHAHFQNGLTLHSMNRPQEAIENFLNCINCKSTIPKSYEHIALGWIHFLNEQVNEAEKEFNLAIEMDPTCSYAYFSRGYVQDVLKRFDDALVSFDLSLKYGPRYSPCGIYNNQAWCYEQKQNCHEQTLKYYTLAIESNASFVRAYFNRSKVYQELNRYDEAIEDLKKVLKINPTHLYSYLELGDIYWFDKNDRESALEYYSFAKNVLSPSNVYPYLLIASIFAYEKNFEAANDELNLGMEKCNETEFLAELQKKKVQYDKQYLQHLNTELSKKPEDQQIKRKIDEINARLERDKYILNNKYYENKIRAKMKQRLKAILYIPLSNLELEATPQSRRPTDNIFEQSPTDRKSVV